MKNSHCTRRSSMAYPRQRAHSHPWIIPVIDFESNLDAKSMWDTAVTSLFEVRRRGRLAAGNRPYDPKRLRPRRDRLGQRGVRRLVGQILRAREEAQHR